MANIRHLICISMMVCCLFGQLDDYELKIDALLNEDSAEIIEDQVREFTTASPRLFPRLPSENDSLADLPTFVELLTEEEQRELVQEDYGHGDHFGKCKDVFIKGKLRITVFIYIDICPDKDQCDTIRAWTTSLSSYILERYSVKCNIRFILRRKCKIHYFPQVTSLLEDLEDSRAESWMRDSQLFPELPATSEKLNFAINFFRGGKNSGAHSKHIVDLERKSYISQVFNFYICKTRAGCVPGRPGGPDRWLSSLNNIVAYSRLRIVRKFACDTVQGAMPIEFYVGKKHRCLCRCPATHKKIALPGAGWRCVRKRKRCKCVWLRKCFKYHIGRRWHNKKCELKNWYSQKAITPIPMAFDSYVGFKTNLHDVPNTSKATKAPCIQLQVGDTVVDYSWKYFQNNREKIFNNMVITSVGVYKITLRAYDYGPNPAVCSTWLVVKDRNRPKSSKKCPSAFGKGGVAPYKRKNYEAAQRSILDYKAWIANRKNDRCTSDWNVDPECLPGKNEYYRWTFCNEYPTQRKIPDLSEPHKCFQVYEDDTKWMQEYLSVHLTTNETPGKPQFCKKCCELHHQFSEWYTPYYCSEKCPPKKCCPGQKCVLKQCLHGSGSKFFKASASVEQKWRNQSRNLGYTARNEIHFLLSSSCTAYDDTTCRIYKKIKALFKEEREYSSSFFETDVFNSFALTNIVKWRYKIGSSSIWTDYNTNDPGLFNKPKTKITLQAWSACGQVCERKFFIYVHLPSSTEAFLSGPTNSTTERMAAVQPAGVDPRAYLDFGFAVAILLVIPIAMTVAVLRRGSSPQADDDSYRQLTM